MKVYRFQYPDGKWYYSDPRMSHATEWAQDATFYASAKEAIESIEKHAHDLRQLADRLEQTKMTVLDFGE